MLFSAFEMGRILEPNAVNVPPQENEPVAIDPKRATEIVKGYARQLGADLVGVCEIDPSWIYSHRGEIHMDNWQDWGREIHADLPYAVVIATEMDHKMVIGAPHTPAVVESSRNYAKGAHITTILARWFTHMGYRATAQHEGHYDALMVPLAVDAGLGQLGRQGYLIADQHGCRVRLSAVFTEMPLTLDKPLDLGIEEFCKACLKCALACPSKSIPSEDKTVNNGTSRWKLSAESCHDYWGKIGTDCCICMAICPYSRPNRSIHKLMKWVIKRSRLARFVLPHLDNMVYGRRWKPRKVAPWVDYRQ
jgi:reductive dehalogenase